MVWVYELVQNKAKLFCLPVKFKAQDFYSMTIF